MADSILASLFSAIESGKRRVKDKFTEEGLDRTGEVLTRKLENLSSQDPNISTKEALDLFGGGVTGTIGSAARVLGPEAAAKAQIMLSKGRNIDEVFNTTKAYEGPLDKQLRANISDEGARLKPIDPDATNLRVGDLLDHQELYRYYPDLASIRLIRETLPKGVSGSLDSKAGILRLNKNESEPDQLLTLLHELQHGIQSQEGFITGSSAKAMANSKLFQQGITDQETMKELAAQKVKNKDPRSLMDILAEKLYRMVGGEAEARAVEKQFLNKDWTSLPTKLYDVDSTKVILPR